MPMPKPKKNEKQDDFIGRCMSFLADEDSDLDQDQRLAACYDSWRRAKGESSLSEDQVERRFIFDHELRLLTDDGRKRLAGYAAVFNRPSEDLGGFREKISPGAFKKSIKAQSDVRAFWNHDPSLVLGRTKSGTLSLKEDKRGLYVEIDPPSWASGYMESVDRGDVDQMSFGFIVNEEEWEHKNDGTSMRTLKDLDLVEVSAVTFPAYPDTYIAVRNYEKSKSTAKAEPKLADADEIVPAPKRWHETGDIRADFRIYLSTEEDKT